MGAATEYELISRAVDFALAHAEAAEAEAIKQLEITGSTPPVNALRTMTMHSTMIAIGCFSVFEALLQQKRGWEKPFPEVDALLRAKGEGDLADRFLDYRNAINVLKHGAGQSYEKLLSRREALAFQIKAKGERFFNEGDVAEGLRLVDANHAFVHQCADIIQEIVAALREPADARSDVKR